MKANNYDEYDEMDEDTTCKFCGTFCKVGDLIWLGGRCMCPNCYIKYREEYYKNDQNSM